MPPMGACGAQQPVPTSPFKPLRRMEARGEKAEARDGDDGGVTTAHSRDKRVVDAAARQEELGGQLQRLPSCGYVSFPDVYHSPHLSYYERFKAYQDYILGDCRPSEVRSFMGEYLEETMEPGGWSAVWRSGAFDVLVEVKDVYFDDLKALVSLSEPLLFEYSNPAVAAAAAASGGPPAALASGEVAEQVLEVAEQALERVGGRVDLRELWVAYDCSGALDRTALAVEHLRFFLGHIWRAWDEEDDDDYDYFVRCVDPRLKLYYDVLEGRIAAGLVSEYARLRSLFDATYAEFSRLRGSLSEAGGEAGGEAGDGDAVARGVQLYESLETTKRKLQIMENPVLRYVLGYQAGGEAEVRAARGPRPDGATATLVVARSASLATLGALARSLAQSPAQPPGGDDEQRIHFHGSLQAALDACYEGDRILLCPGVHTEEGVCSMAESVSIEGFGVADDVVLELRGRGAALVACSERRLSVANLKIIQHGASEGLLRVLRGEVELRECVLQCETSGVTVRPNAHLTLKNCNLYGAKGPGVEVYPGSSCSLIGNEIHHCREGVLIMDFMESVYDMPELSMMNNLISNNDGYGVSLLKPEEPGRPGTLKRSSADLGLSPALTSPSGRDEGGARAAPHAEQPEEAITAELVTSSQKKREWRESAAAAATATDEQPMETQAADGDAGHAEARAGGELPADMLLSIVGNSFCRNGKGSFGVLYY